MLLPGRALKRVPTLTKRKLRRPRTEVQLLRKRRRPGGLDPRRWTLLRTCLLFTSPAPPSAVPSAGWNGCSGRPARSAASWLAFFSGRRAASSTCHKASRICPRGCVARGRTRVLSARRPSPCAPSWRAGTQRRSCPTLPPRPRRGVPLKLWRAGRTALPDPVPRSTPRACVTRAPGWTRLKASPVFGSRWKPWREQLLPPPPPAAPAPSRSTPS